MYHPSQKIIDNYADVLIKFALNNCEGIKKGDVVLLNVPEVAKPMLVAMRRAVLEAGGHPLINYIPTGIGKEFYDLAGEEQLSFFPRAYMKGLVDQVDHSVFIIAETDKHELQDVDPKAIMARSKVFKPYMQWREKKEGAGKFTWTVALYGTPAEAKEVGMSEKAYWDQIINACYLNEKNPIKHWKKSVYEVERVKMKLNKLKIQKVHVVAKNTDLWVKLGDDRIWMGGSGRNIPSFEVFISPDWRGTSGHIQFTEPLYRYGNLITDVYLEFKKGLVTKCSATKGEHVIKAMIKTKNADKIGEYSLTDSRLSRITKFMGETLFDENVGGKYGNTHLALGNAYQDSFPGDITKVKTSEWKKMGYNSSAVHTDIVQTCKRTVTAYFKKGSPKIIYKDGKFLI